MTHALRSIALFVKWFVSLPYYLWISILLNIEEKNIYFSIFLPVIMVCLSRYNFLNWKASEHILFASKFIVPICSSFKLIMSSYRSNITRSTNLRWLKMLFTITFWILSGGVLGPWHSPNLRISWKTAWPTLPFKPSKLVTPKEVFRSNRVLKKCARSHELSFKMVEGEISLKLKKSKKVLFRFQGQKVQVIIVSFPCRGWVDPLVFNKLKVLGVLHFVQNIVNSQQADHTIALLIK